jgi:hypothetical protein
VETSPLNGINTTQVLLKEMNTEPRGISEMDKKQRKKSGRFKPRRPTLKRLGNGGMSGGGSRWTRPPPFTPRRDYGYKPEQKYTPKEEKSHWNGKVQMWTEPQKPRQEKIVRYEVDTDKLLNELARGNKETINEIAEKIIEAKSENDSENKETQAETNPQESDKENLQKLDSSEKTDKESNIPEAEPDKVEESLESLDKETETNKEGDQGEAAEEKTEASEEKTDITEPVEQTENAAQENQEMPQDTETEPETNPQEDPLDAPELVYMSPSFWEQLESEMSDELEQLEPEENLETPQEEGEPFSEGY